MYKDSLKTLRTLADEILSGAKEGKVVKTSNTTERSLVQRPQRQEPETQDEYASDKALLDQMLFIKKMAAEGSSNRALYTESEGGLGESLRPVSRGDALNSDTGVRLMKDLQRDLGLTKEQAAGLVGNLDYETGGFKFMQEIDPVVEGSRGGYGFAQWTGPRRKAFEAWSEEKGLDISSYEANYGFLIHELTETSEGRFMDKLRKATDAGEAAIIVSDGYLIPGVKAHNKRKMRAYGYTEVNEDQ